MARPKREGGNGKQPKLPCGCKPGRFKKAGGPVYFAANPKLLAPLGLDVGIGIKQCRQCKLIIDIGLAKNEEPLIKPVGGAFVTQAEKVRLLAEGVMGWAERLEPIVRRYDEYGYRQDKSNPLRNNEFFMAGHRLIRAGGPSRQVAWNPYENIADAMMLLERGVAWNLECQTGPLSCDPDNPIESGLYECEYYWEEDNGFHMVEARGETPEEAICEAALKTQETRA